MNMSVCLSNCHSPVRLRRMHNQTGGFDPLREEREHVGLAYTVKELNAASNVCLILVHDLPLKG